MLKGVKNGKERHKEKRVGKRKKSNRGEVTKDVGDHRRIVEKGNKKEMSEECCTGKRETLCKIYRPSADKNHQEKQRFARGQREGIVFPGAKGERGGRGKTRKNSKKTETIGKKRGSWGGASIQQSQEDWGCRKAGKNKKKTNKKKIRRL